jgi:transcriptional antiterminator NusG
MKLSEDAWYIVRNTPGVTGFVGSGTDPTPIETDEIEKIQKRMGLEQPKHKIDFNPGDVVNIIDGPFKGFDGSVSEIDPQKGKLKVLVNMFGRETPVELDSLQVKRV